jgi:hypothetical protein
MSNDFTVSAVTAIPSRNSTPVKPTAAAVEPTTLADPAPTPPLTVNPVLRLDEGLGLVVIEFHDDRGVITNSIPSQQQLEAYRRWDRSRFGPTPPDRTDTVASTPPADLHTPTVAGQHETKPVKTPHS